MKCPSCGHEPQGALLNAPCPVCTASWWDTANYVAALTTGMSVVTALDVGCGEKGIIAQDHWENVKKIKRGYACDRFKIKALPGLWRPMVADAENLPELLPENVDVTTHCGLLEHIPYTKALGVMYALEQVTTKLIFMSCSAELRAVDYKVRRDNNYYHYYRSFWDADTLEALGYTVDRSRMKAKQTFDYEVMAWMRLDKPRLPWHERVVKARAILAARRCGEAGCNAEPFVWDVHTEKCYCLVHAFEKRLGADCECNSWKWWLEQDDVGRFLPKCTPSWRLEKLVPRRAKDLTPTRG